MLVYRLASCPVNLVVSKKLAWSLERLAYRRGEKLREVKTVSRIAYRVSREEDRIQEPGA
jgi:hypothetical protein